MIVTYNSTYEKQWDRFVLGESVNGTFLQTRRFLNYHPCERFQDNSIMFMKGTTIIAVVPAHIVWNGGEKRLISHQGSTFGGIVLGKRFKKISAVELIFEELEDYLRENEFSEIVLKMTSPLYATVSTELIDYFLFLNGYNLYSEMGYFIDFKEYNCDISANFSFLKRRDYKKSLKNHMTFRLLSTDEEITDFYSLLSDNYKKFGTSPVHTLDELLEIKKEILKENIEFYGVYYEESMVAGSMVFAFEKKVFHTQYLASSQKHLSLYPNEFLCENLIETAYQSGFEKLSFGTSTREYGKILNKSLALFKEGFGTSEYVNRTYYKHMN